MLPTHEGFSCFVCLYGIVHSHATSKNGSHFSKRAIVVELDRIMKHLGHEITRA
jgi:hypothetical protein